MRGTVAASLGWAFLGSPQHPGATYSELILHGAHHVEGTASGSHGVYCKLQAKDCTVAAELLDPNSSPRLLVIGKL